MILVESLAFLEMIQFYYCAGQKYAECVPNIVVFRLKPKSNNEE